MGELNTRMTIEDFVANLSSEYYNLIRQKIRLRNLRSTLDLSKERLRIVEERYYIGSIPVWTCNRLKWTSTRIAPRY